MTIQLQVKNSKQKRWLTGGIISLLTIVAINILGKLFPYTGLAAIIVLPFIFLLNSLIIIWTIRLTKNVQRPGYILSWFATSILTILIAIALYPQEFRPNVFKQIGYSISAIKQFDKSPITDLDLPFTVDDFSRYDCEEKDASERYIVALYKYQNSIPLNGSFHIYREEKTGVISYDSDTSIKNINDIPNKLRTGQDRLIWWTLKRMRK